MIELARKLAILLKPHAVWILVAGIISVFVFFSATLAPHSHIITQIILVLSQVAMGWSFSLFIILFTFKHPKPLILNEKVKNEFWGHDESAKIINSFFKQSSSIGEYIAVIFALFFFVTTPFHALKFILTMQ